MSNYFKIMQIQYKINFRTKIETSSTAIIALGPFRSKPREQSSHKKVNLVEGGGELFIIVKVYGIFQK